MEFHHIGLAVKDLLVAEKHYESLLGLQRTSEPVFDRIQKVKILFMKQPETDLKYELIEPTGPDSPAFSWLKKRTPLYHICYQVRNLENAIETMSREGCLLIGNPVPASALHDRRVAFLITSENLMIELVERGKR